MKAIDTFTPAEAVADPKNLVLAVGGAVSMASSTATAGGKTVAGVLMVLIASLCALLPLTVHLGGGTKSAKVLGDRQLPQPERAHPQRRRFPEQLTAPRSLSDATT
ncbi:hypothetical protein [Streptomyces sp. CB02115]|uniref:hypothetical protein n=1 Tax=Streptomyces sp. CB02115 TaxID=1703939 RepID=UPI00093EA8AB|nr:hypothetical protein [Streptomyces sp. CB02115]